MPTTFPFRDESAQLQLRAQQRAFWEFAARIDDWRCTVCWGRVAFEDRDRFERTHLCLACSEAVNESLVWQAANDQEA